MPKGAILLFAFFLCVHGCSIRVTPQVSSFPLLIESPYYPDEYFSGLPLEEKAVEEVKEEKGEVKKEIKEVREAVKEEEKGREDKEEIKEQIKEAKETEKIEVSHLVPDALKAEPPKESLRLPDIAVSKIFLKQKRRLYATLTNLGTAPFPMESGGLSLFIDGQLEKQIALKSLSEMGQLPPQESITLALPFSLYQRREVGVRVDTSEEVGEANRENNFLKQTLEGAPMGPDIIVSDFDLNDDLELMILLSNVGEVDLRKGVTFRIRIFLNDRKISDFEHFISEEIKAHLKNHYLLLPPYRVTIRGGTRVKVSLSPKVRSDDIRTENNVLERRFIIFPFQIGGHEREQFSFLIPRPSLKEEDPPGKIKMKVRWVGQSDPLKFSFEGSEGGRTLLDTAGTSPVKVEWPLLMGHSEKESYWRVSVTNPMDKRAEGHLIVQYP